MISKNFYGNEVVVAKGAENATLTADQDGDTIDTLGFGSTVLLVDVGTSGDTLSGSVYIELEVEDSPDDSAWADCADAQLQNPDTGAAGAVTGTNTGTFALIDAAAEDDALFAVRVVNTDRYVRVVVNVTGTHTNGTPIAITALQARRDYV